jgi:KDO2-lipid IV(A) lauroyltransferase
VSSATARRCAWIAPADWLASLVAGLPQRWLLRFGAIATRMLWPLLGRRRRIARRNIALCFPELDDHAQRRLLDATLRATVTGAFELLRAWFAPADALRGLFEVVGLEHLRAARAGGRGVLLVSGHMPNVELAGRLAGEALGEPIVLIGRRHNDPCMERWLDAARRRAFATTIDKKDKATLLQVLREGATVLYVADQDFSYRNAFVPFFGVAAATLTALPELMEQTGAVALPTWLQRQADGRYRLEIGAQWTDWPSGDRTADAARYMAELETVVRRHPEQYLWVHRRFKTRPPGEPPLY